ncbi:MAG TPA: PAS domain S-box protein [Thermoguttaceae bacterium]|nr:PAS domain S-box protein [Thermoguttaceae bacterium]
MSDSGREAGRPIRLRQFAWSLTGLWTVALGVMLVWDLVAEQQRAGTLHRTIGFGSAWVLGLGGILLASHQLWRVLESRRQAESALRETQVRLRETAAHIPGVVYQFVLHPDGSRTFPYVSEGVAEILGLSPEELTRNPAALFPGVLFEEDVDAVWQSIRASAETMTTWQRELQCKSTAGEIKWIRATSSPHRLPDGSVLWNGVFLDVTDRKEVERRLQEAHHALEQRVVERTAELEEANRELQKEIAERKQAEQWLLQSEERFRSYFELGLIGMAIVSPQKEWLEVNPHLCNMLGYSENDLIGKTWTELTHPEDRQADETQFERVLARATNRYSIDKRFVCKDGRTIYTIHSVRCLRRSDGAVDCLLTLVQDITHRKQAEDALRQSQRFLQTVIDAVPDVTVVIDRDYRVVLANRVARRRAGNWDPATHCLACFQLFHQRDMPCAGEIGPCPLKEVIRTKAPATVTHTHRDADGNVRIREISAAPIFNESGKVVQIVESARDVTERTHAEKALQQSEQRFRSLVEAASDWIWEIDRDAAYTYASPKIRDLLGYEPEELIGKTPFDLMPPEEADVISSEFRNLCKSGEPIAGLENVHLHKDGRRVVLETSAAPIFDADGNLCGYRGIDRDVTQRKQAEESLRRYELQEKEHIEAELQKTREQLVRQTRLAAIGQISASIAHELRNPLGCVRNAAFLLKKRVPPEETKWREYLGIIERETAAADRIINDLTAMSRGKKPVKRSVDLRTVVVAARSRVAAPPQIRWCDAYQPDPLIVDADAAQLEQVLRNLFANSVQALDGDGTISVEAARTADHDRILVCDDGPGISAEDCPHVFDPLFSKRNRGAGLGLTICRQVIERHGGTIEVGHSDRGTTICILLPRKAE